MGCGASRQNRVEATSDNAMRSDRGHPTGTSMSRPENDRALKISPVSIRVSLPGSILPQEVQPNTNYHMRRNFSRQSDGLVQFVHVAADNNVDREVGLTTEAIQLILEIIRQPGPFRPYEVVGNKNYRMWTIFSRESDGLVQLDPDNHNVHCKGAFNDKTAVISTSDFNESYISLLFEENEKQYVLTAQADSNDNIKIAAVQTPSGSTYPDEAQFAPHQYWGYTFFQNKFHNQKYLSSDSTGNMTLVDIADLDYPHPQALFILNKV